MRGVTERQMLVLKAIAGYLDEHGFPPSLRELGPMLGIRSLRGVTQHLVALEKKGLIEREAYISRGIKLTEDGRAHVER